MEQFIQKIIEEAKTQGFRGIKKQCQYAQKKYYMPCICMFHPIKKRNKV